jgi:hypothetical protein
MERSLLIKWLFSYIYKKTLSPEIFNKRTKKKQGVFFAQSSEWDWRIKCWHNVVCTARDAGERNRKIRPNSNQKRRWRRSPITSTIRLEVAIRKAHQPSNNRVVLIWGRPLRYRQPFATVPASAPIARPSGKMSIIHIEYIYVRTYRRIHCVISFYCVALGGSQQQGTVVNPVAAALCALIVYSEFLIHPMVLLSTSRRMRQEVLRTLKRHSPCCCW